MHLPDLHITNQWILAQRGNKNEVDPLKPYAYLVEKERQPNGCIEDIATVFLTNRECPFRCLMCDLWKNTTDTTVPSGIIPQQIAYALERLPSTTKIKLYNSGNFFDPKAIPPADYDAIIQQLKGFDAVLVENHPKLINQNVADFRDKLKTELQVAVGLETVHPEVLPRLNKKMTLDDFSESVKFLNQHDILSRAFILLRPPFLDEEEGVIWAKKSFDFAFDAGVECCAVIPTRAGNGGMDQLEKSGFFQSPKIQSLESVLDYGISLKRGRVFADLWDFEHFSSCSKCRDARKERIEWINNNQQHAQTLICDCG